MKKTKTTAVLENERRPAIRGDPRLLSFPLTNGFNTEYARSPEQIQIPAPILFHDYLCTKPLRRLELKHWVVNEELLQLISTKCPNSMTLNLDMSPNLNISHFRAIRGHKSLRKLSIQRLSCVLDREFIEVVSSLKALIYLDMSYNTFTDGVFDILSTSCADLKYIGLAHCKGIDDFALAALGQCIERYRQLERINLSGTLTFTDEGVLAMISSGRSVLRDVDLSSCTQLTNLSLSIFRGKMSTLRRLSLSSLSTEMTLFEYLGESYKVLTALDLSDNLHLSDLALGCIGKHCKHLEALHLRSCMHITDEGINAFFSTFQPVSSPTCLSSPTAGSSCSSSSSSLPAAAAGKGVGGVPVAGPGGVYPPSRLTCVDLSLCVGLGSGAITALASYTPHLHRLHLDGLSRANPTSLELLARSLDSLEVWTMPAVLGEAVRHRQSTLPHLTDAALSRFRSDKLTQLNLSGAVQVGDSGVLAVVAVSRASLSQVDLSYLPRLSDAALKGLAQCPALLSLQLSGCVHLTDEGLAALCGGREEEGGLWCSGREEEGGLWCGGREEGGLWRTLQSLAVDGCRRLTDRSVKGLARCVRLRHLSLQGVDQVTDASLRHVFSSLHDLQSVDVSGCDLVSEASLGELLEHNLSLQRLACAKCNLSSTDLLSLLQGERRTKDLFPLALGEERRCRLLPQTACVAAFNGYILNGPRRLLPALAVLTRFLRFLHATHWRRLAGQARRHRRRLLLSHLAAWREVLLREKRRTRLFKILRSVFVVQAFLRSVYVSHRARDKLVSLKKRKRGIVTIQRVFRGYRSRKRTARLRGKYERAVRGVVRLLVTYYVLHHARRLTQAVLVSLQAWGRGLPHARRYRAFLHAVRTLQHHFRQHACQRQQTEKHIREKREEEKRVYILRQMMASRLQRNLKHLQFNRQMSKFIFVCAIYWRTERDEEEYYSTILQRYLRGYTVRRRLYRTRDRSQREGHAILRLQTAWRRYIARKKYLRIRDRKRRARRHLRRVLQVRRPRLRLGRYVKVLQRSGKLFLFRCRRHAAAVAIQRVFRGYRGRQRWVRVVHKAWDMYATRIQRLAHRFVCRRRRLAQWRREHMAAFRIWLAVDKIFEVQRRMRRKEVAQRQARQTLLASKQAIVTKRREYFVQKIRDAYRNSQALKIQRVYRAYQERKREEERSLMRSSSSATLMDASSWSAPAMKQSKLLQRLALPGRMLSQQVNKLKTVFKPTDLIPPTDEKKFVNAVLTYQVKSILQEGIIDLAISVGEVERKTMESQQRQFKNAHLPYFLPLEDDLSGYLQLDVYVWVLYGEGLDCICALTVAPKPLNTSNAAMKIRETTFKDRGVKLIWHPQLHFELHAERSVKQGKPAFAIQNLQITSSAEGAEAMQSPGSRMTLVADLSTVGIHGVCLWSTLRKPTDADLLYRFQRLTAYDWFDARLERIVKSFTLTEEDVLALRRCYDELLQSSAGGGGGGGGRLILRIQDLFEALAFSARHPLAQWLVNTVSPAHPKEVSFSEFVHLVAAFVMLSPKDLARWVFQQADTEGNFYLRREQFTRLVQMLGEGGPFNVKIWEGQYDRFHDVKLKQQFVKNFLDFVDKNPGVLWQPQKLQQQLMDRTLGRAYWAKKMEQYRVVRQGLGIKLL